MHSLLNYYSSVGLKQAVLNDTVFFKFCFSKLFGIFSRDLSCLRKNRPVRYVQEFIYTFSPILHCHWNMAFRHIFRYIKKAVDDASHCFQFICRTYVHHWRNCVARTELTR